MTDTQIREKGLIIERAWSQEEHRPLITFIARKSVESLRHFFATTAESVLFIPEYLRKRPKDFVNCAAVYLLIAIVVDFSQGDLPSFRRLLTSAIIGGFVSPFVIPWVRAFPLTGDPAHSGLKRAIDFSFNAACHFISMSVFIWVLKAAIATLGHLLFDQPWLVPTVFEAGLLFVIVNNIRKVGTEYLGIRFLIYLHPQGRATIAKMSHERCW